MSKPSDKKAARRREREGGRGRDARRLSDFGIRNSMGGFWPAQSGPNSISVHCDGCNSDFIIPSGATVIGMSQDPDEIAWTAGPCPTCYRRGVKVFGTPRLFTAWHETGSVWAIAATPELAEENIYEGMRAIREQIPPTAEMAAEMAAKTAAQPVFELAEADVPAETEGEVVLESQGGPGRRERRRLKQLVTGDDGNWGNSNYDPNEKPWPRGGPWVHRCAEHLDASVVHLGNWYGHVDGYEDDFTWCLCAGCDKPFQYWGSFALYFENDERKVADVVKKIAFGPCTHCGGVGKPIEPLVSTNRGGLTTVASSPTIFELPLLERMSEALKRGTLDVEGAVDALRSDGRPIYTAMADWIERRQATATVTATVLMGILTIVGTQLANDDKPEPGLTEREVVVILEQLLEQYENSTPGTGTPSVSVDVDEGGRGDVHVDVDVNIEPPAH